MPDEKTGVAIIKTALQEPLRQIAANAGLDASVIINEILKKVMLTTVLMQLMKNVVT